ncbi:pectate lyase a [Moniliophthora roreri MCA 2997]|uniref:Pectate lyase a n=1 Tax=Moniliophthora roreri (strain MCA 2997) TaxID=1381753 RepID=V2WEU8_MONRO|nr:pectate lyase a [Moniliophthora roreri MCA 2997]
MKWFTSIFAVFVAQLVMASPLEKRASVNDVATVGYATLNGGTTGGSGGTQTTVTTLSALTSAVSGDAKKIVIISGTITGNTVVKVGPNTTVIGKTGSQLVGVGLRVLEVNNVIIRNVKISKVLADAGDAIVILIMISYDGLLDITHGCTGVTVSNSKLYNHWKASLVGHSDSNGDEDVKITVTYVGNYWSNLNSRTPSFRFGHGHIFNNYFENNNDGINTRDGAQLLVENNVWVGGSDPLYATDEGFAVSKNNDFDGMEDTAPTGNFNTAPYSYSLIATSSVVSSVKATAGQTLAF